MMCGKIWRQTTSVADVVWISSVLRRAGAGAAAVGDADLYALLVAGAVALLAA